MTIYIHKTETAFHIFQDSAKFKTIKEKIGQFSTWEELLAAIRSDFQGCQIVPQF
jgi:hypothetical protein